MFFLILRYFYPLITTFSTYRGLESAKPENLPVATNIVDSVTCLPMYAGLTKESVEKIISIITI
jgi:dTDP-4-amino-4,6-dideoxygalactose transaminase